MSSTFYPARRANQSGTRRWLIGGATLAAGAAIALAVAFQPPAVEPVAPPAIVVPPAAAVSAIEGYAVEGSQGYEWRGNSATGGYAVVEGPFGYQVLHL